MSSQNIMEKAESRFLETQKKTAERNKATAEYVSEAKARSVKTARLRELRLAKEAAEKESIESKPVRRQTGKPRRRTCDAKNPQPLCGTSRRP